MRRFLSLLLALSLVLSSFTLSLAAPDVTVEEHELKVDLGDSISSDPRVQGKSDSDWVRVIVELNDDPVIDYAIRQGVRLAELPEGEVTDRVADLHVQHQQIKDSLRSTDSSVEYHGDFFSVFNGFSATMSVGKAKEVEQMPNVKRVVVSTKYELPVEPNMKSSSTITKHNELWSLGYKGEGMVVAVLDTGVDPNHKDMQTITDPSKAKIKNLNGFNLPGTYRNIKVPYGYNYMDNNQEILDLGPEASMHGMHVAGTVGANGGDDGIKGVAPEAQILAMKVFGNDAEINTTYSDIYVRAIDDALVLGADAINMSLGSPASFLQDEADDPARVAIRKASESGVVVAISAGNSNRFGNGYKDWPNTIHTDTAVVGSPSLNPESLSVASIENVSMTVSTLKTPVTTMGAIAFLAAGQVDPATHFSGAQPYVFCGLGGSASDFPAAVNGKIALISRGSFAFVDKINNAVNAGATGVIVHNNREGALVNMKTPSGLKIPAVFISQEDGNKLRGLLGTPDATVAFTTETKSIVNPNAGLMSDFSSWGPAPNLAFKPEITAPGGKIYSTLQDNKYGVKSGTSMAAPHVSGGTALVMQYLDEKFNVAGKARYQLAKNLLMSTATPHIQAIHPQLQQFKYYVSPRKQGAGVMNLPAATSSGAIVVNPMTGESKVNLKVIGEKASFQVKLDNFAGNETTYRIKMPIMSEISYKGSNWPSSQQILHKDNKRIYDIKLNGTSVDQVTVATGGSVTLDVSFDLTDTIDWWNEKPLKEVYKNGNFVDGFVIFEDIQDRAPQLSIPFISFYGEWDKARIFDFDAYRIDQEKGEVPFYASRVTTTMTWPEKKDDGTSYVYLGTTSDGKKLDAIAFSPDNDGSADTAMPIITFLRNAKYFEANILDQDKNVVRKIATNTDIRKNYHDGRYPMFTAKSEWQWDGKINGEQKTSGTYYYQIKAKIDYPNARWQTLEFPIYIDIVDPVVTQPIAFDAAAKKLTVQGKDETSPEVKYTLFLDNKEIESNYTGEFTVNKTDIVKAQVEISDYAFNVTKSDTFVINADKDTTVPFVHLKEPKPFEIFNKRDIAFNGYIVEDTNIKSFTIDGDSVDTVFNTETKQFDFEYNKTYATDGVKTIKVAATDSNDQNIAFERTIFVDATAPRITIEKIVNGSEVIAPSNATEYQLKGQVSDNFTSLTVMLNGNEVFRRITDPAAGDVKDKAIVYNIDKVIKLTGDKTPVVIKGIDYAGNEYKRTVYIVRGQSTTSGGSGGSGGSSGSSSSGSSTGSSTTPPSNTNKYVEKAKQANLKINSDLTDVSGKKLISTKVPSGKNPKQYAYYRFNEQAGKWEYVGGKLLNGQMTVTADKAGKYALMLYEKDFDDISSDLSWAKDAIDVLSSRRIINGESDTRFAPKKEISREAFAALIFRAFDLKSSSKKSFNDVNGWSKNAVETLASLGIMKGYGEDFKPKQVISRQEMAVTIVRLLKAIDFNLPDNVAAVDFDDAKDIANWAKDDVAIANKLQLIKGYGDKFGPKDSATRAQAATIIYRLLELADLL